MPLTASFPDLRNTGTSHKKSQGGVRKPRNKVRLAWAYTAADGGCLPFLTQNALLNPKGKKSFVADTGEVPLTEDKTLGYLRASFRPSVWIWISGQLSRVTASITTRLSTLETYEKGLMDVMMVKSEAWNRISQTYLLCELSHILHPVFFI